MQSEFAEELASAAPTPGGGGASAYCGALAAALASMVGNLTIGKKRYADVEDEMRASLGRLEQIREELLGLVDADAEAFQPLAAAYRMPSDSPEAIAAKDAALQGALIGAIEVPLQIMEACCAALSETQLMAQKGSRMALSDAGVAAVFAKAALQGASLNVRINLSSLTDEAKRSAYAERMDALLAEGCALADAIYMSVVDEV